MKQIFLDLDGTLIDSSQRHVEVLKKALFKSGYKDKDVADFVHYKAFGNTTTDYLKNVIKLDDESAKKISHLWMENIENPEFQILDTLFEDSYSFLEEVKSYGYVVRVVTARKNEGAVIYSVKRLKIKDYIDELKIVSPNSAIEEKTRYLTSNCNRQDIFIGDTEVDYISAKNTGIHFCALDRGFRNKSFWAKYTEKTYSGLYEVIDDLKITNNHL